MNNKVYYQLLVIQALVDNNKRVTDKIKQNNDELKNKLNRNYFEFSEIKLLLNRFMGHNQTSSPEQVDSPKSQDLATVVLDKKRYPPLRVGHSTKIGGMWILKQEIISPKLYKLLVKEELKVDTALELNNVYNRINICPNALTIL